MSDLEINRRSSLQPTSAPDSTSPNFGMATEPSYTATLFFGPEGLRPGWGLLFYIVVFYALQKVTIPWAWARDFGAAGLWSMLLEELCSLAAAVIPALILSRVEHHPWKTYGLPSKLAFGRLFWTGALWGFSGITLLMFALYGVRAFSFGHIVLHGFRLVRFAAFWAGMFLLVGLFEEFLLRGYTQFTLGRGIGFWPAALVMSSAFGIIHLRNEGEQWRGVLAAAFIGLFFCLTLRRTGSLWFAVGFHALWDWGETFFYSVPDSGMIAPGHLLRSSLHGAPWLSGGSVGPEGSVLCFVVIGFIWFAFDRMYPKVNSSPSPRSSEKSILSSVRDLGC